VKIAKIKTRWMEVADQDEVKALIANGKYRPEKPFWVREKGKLWVELNDQFKAWRANFGNTR
jgi:hypothetical protein